jgi:hypothetical protein
MSLLGLFPHRTNHDGTVDSICSKCFQTVASWPAVSDLALAEGRHRCDVNLMFARFPANSVSVRPRLTLYRMHWPPSRTQVD